MRHGIRSYINNVDLANEYIHTDLVRPPYGWLKWEQYFFLRRRYQLVMWDLVTRDYSKLLTPEDVLDNVKRLARPGSIITFHDSLKSQDKLWYALPRSIEWLKSQGYAFRTLPVKHPEMLA
jgi:peptidoglycan/xylan/chitin deacetylase (PgdA/CDA1 family)